MTKGRRSISVNLGCGLMPRPGFINIGRATPGADASMDPLILGFRDESVGRLEALGVVERLGLIGARFALSEWYRVLAAEGALVVESFDFLAAARNYVAGVGGERAAISASVFAVDEPGWGARFGFDLDQLQHLLSEAGFTDLRRNEHRRRPQVSTIRLEARRRLDFGSLVRARFYSEVWRRGLVSSHPAFGLEFLEEVGPALSDALRIDQGQRQQLDEALLSLTLWHPEAARAAVRLVGEHMSRARLQRWRETLADPGIGDLAGDLVGRLITGQPEPGRMERRVDTLLSEGRRQIARRLEQSRVLRPPPSGSPSRRWPLSPTALRLEAAHRHALGVRKMLRGDPGGALTDLRAAAALDSNDPIAFWNLGRATAQLGWRGQALAAFEQAATAAQMTGAGNNAELQRDIQRMTQGLSIESSPIGPDRLAPPPLGRDQRRRRGER